MFKDVDKHDNRCAFKIMNCKNKCGEVLERQELDSHYQVWELEPITCTYYEFGCDTEIIRKEYQTHLEEFAYDHSLMFVEGQKKVNQENEELK